MGADHRRSQRLLVGLALGESDPTFSGTADDSGQNLLDAARFHRLLPQLAARAADLGLPELAIAAIHRAHLEVATQSLRLVGALHRLAPALDDVSAWVSVKGVALATRYYGAPESRQTSDVDVLVPRDRLLAAVDALEAGGLSPAVGWRRRVGRGDGEVALRVSQHVTLDLHWSLLHGPEARAAFDLPTSELLQDAVTVEVSPGLVVPTTGPADTLLHLAYHTAMGNAERLGSLNDLRLVARSIDDWDDVVARARRRRMGLLLGTMLRRVDSTFGTSSSPRDVQRALSGRTVWGGVHHAVDAARPPESSYGRVGHGRLLVGSTRDTTTASLATAARHGAADLGRRLRGSPSLADTRFPTPGVHLRVLLLSLEPWDEVWRRNQHLVRAMLDDWYLESVTFVEPAARRGRLSERSPYPRVRALRPVQTLPDKGAGKAQLARWIRRELLGDHDVLWINDAPLGRWVQHPDVPSVHDVTDDWREIPQPPDARRRLVAAEDRLARTARTVVCSDVLAQRWWDRYGVAATMVPNAVDLRGYGFGEPLALPGGGPHLLYAGTLHRDRLDIELLCRLTGLPEVGTVHLLGPDLLPEGERAALVDAGVLVHAPVPGPEVGRWLQSADVLLVPHRVTPFTLSLDAIKAYEYQAARRPVVATPTSGFQHLTDSGMLVVPQADFVTAVGQVLRAERTATAHADPPDWRVRGKAMADVLREVVEKGYPPATLV